MRHPELKGYWWCSLQANLGRYVDPDGWGLCPVSAAATAAEAVLAEASPVIDACTVQVARVDLAMNFYGVRNTGEMLSALARVPRRFSRRGPVRYLNLDDLGQAPGQVGLPKGPIPLGTLYLPRRATGDEAAVYDKSAEWNSKPRRAPIPDGVLRAEFRSLRNMLREFGVNAAHDLTEDRLERLWTAWWTWAGLDAAVVTPAALEALLEARDDLTPTTRRNTMKHLALLGLGTPSRAVVTAFQRAQAVPVVPGDEGRVPHDFACRLDPAMRSAVDLLA